MAFSPVWLVHSQTGDFRGSLPDWSTQQLVCPDVACHSLWSSHTPLVSGDAVDMTGIGRDAMDGQTPWEQGMGLGWPFVVLQHRINPQSCGCNLQEVGTMQLVGRECRALRVLDEVIAL